LDQTHFLIEESTSSSIPQEKHHDLSKIDLFLFDPIASLVKGEAGNHFRLPKGAKAFDRFSYRKIRRMPSGNWLVQLQGTFYKVPTIEGIHRVRPNWIQMSPIASHEKQISDFGFWKDFLILTGVKNDPSANDNHIFGIHSVGYLWLGACEDLFQLGKPAGEGGVWLDSPVKEGDYSDPYLMAGYDQRTLILAHNRPTVETFMVEIAQDSLKWVEYGKFEVAPDQSFHLEFPDDYSAHWCRVKAPFSGLATAWFVYK